MFIYNSMVFIRKSYNDLLVPPGHDYIHTDIYSKKLNWVEIII